MEPGRARVCCGLTAHYELAQRPDLYGRPVVVAAWREQVVCASPGAEGFGVQVGMSQRQAQQLCPDAVFLDPDPDAAGRLRELVGAALYDLSPVVEARVDGCAWIDLDGVVQATDAVREMRRPLRPATRGRTRPRPAPRA